jgi:hypothetical protein
MNHDKKNRGSGHSNTSKLWDSRGSDVFTDRKIPRLNDPQASVLLLPPALVLPRMSSSIPSFHVCVCVYVCVCVRVCVFAFGRLVTRPQDTNRTPPALAVWQPQPTSRSIILQQFWSTQETVIRQTILSPRAVRCSVFACVMCVSLETTYLNDAYILILFVKECTPLGCSHRPTVGRVSVQCQLLAGAGQGVVN